jgi:hypothetical protein
MTVLGRWLSHEGLDSASRHGRLATLALCMTAGLSNRLASYEVTGDDTGCTKFCQQDEQLAVLKLQPLAHAQQAMQQRHQRIWDVSTPLWVTTGTGVDGVVSQRMLITC